MRSRQHNGPPGRDNCSWTTFCQKPKHQPFRVEITIWDSDCTYDRRWAVKLRYIKLREDVTLGATEALRLANELINLADKPKELHAPRRITL